MERFLLVMIPCLSSFPPPTLFGKVVAPLWLPPTFRESNPRRTCRSCWRGHSHCQGGKNSTSSPWITSTGCSASAKPPVWTYRSGELRRFTIDGGTDYLVDHAIG